MFQSLVKVESEAGCLGEEVRSDDDVGTWNGASGDFSARAWELLIGG